MRYFVEKKKYNAKNVEHLDIVFQNGNYLRIKKGELADLRLDLYDRLVRYEDSASFVGHSGYVRLKISSKKRTPPDGTAFLYNFDSYKKDRKSYIETRCVEENDVAHLVFYDGNNWNDMIFGDILCHMDGEFLILQFEPNQKYGSADSDIAYIDLPDISKKDILRMTLDFENCETVTVYENEIRDIDLIFEEQLEWSGGDFCRRVKSGILELKLRKEYRDRSANLYDSGRSGTTVGTIIKRLCGKGQDIHDICHLYITYGYVGYGHLLEEKIEIADMRLYEEKHRAYDGESDEYIYDDGYEIYIGGCANAERDGVVTVRFGACCADDVRKIVKKKNPSVSFCLTR